MNLSGQTLGNYRLEGVLAHGPRATVYRARHASDSRIVAVKVYDESVDPDRMRQSIEATQALTNAHVLPVDAFDVQRGLALVAMRYMPKGSIKTRGRRAASLAEVARSLTQVASALEHAHAHGLLHLNLKPSNILLDHPGNAFVADFGVPPQADSPYLAPEAARGGTLDAHADVYALGAIVYELATGRAPVARRPRDESANQRMAELPTPRSIRSDIPPAVEAVILRALSIDPASRHATPNVLAEAFAEAVETAAADQPAKPARPAGLAWIAAGAVGLLILIGVLVVSSGTNAPAAAPSPTIADAFTSTPAATDAPTPAVTPTATPRAATATPTARLATSTPSGTPAPTASASPPPVTRAAVNATPVFRVVSLVLKPPANRDVPGERLNLLFDAVIEPAEGGPFGQLFVYLPDIDSLVTTRIGAQVSSGVQVLNVTLAVDCRQLSAPFATDRLFLEIRETDRGPVLYAQTIEYTKIWCR